MNGRADNFEEQLKNGTRMSVSKNGQKLSKCETNRWRSPKDDSRWYLLSQRNSFDDTVFELSDVGSLFYVLKVFPGMKV